MYLKELIITLGIYNQSIKDFIYSREDLKFVFQEKFKNPLKKCLTFKHE